MKISVKRKLEIKIKTIISKIILFFLFRGFKATYKYDKRVRNEIDNWKEGFSIKLQIAPNGSCLNIKKTKEGLIKPKEIENPNTAICFKSIDAAFLVLTGRLAVSGAYAGHRFKLSGEISEAMSFVRCVDIVEAYLFPKFITKRILKEVPKKYVNIITTYRYVLFNF